MDNFDLELLAAYDAISKDVDNVSDELERIKYRIRLQIEPFNLSDNMQMIADSKIDSIRTHSDVDDVRLLIFHIEPPPYYNPLKMLQYCKKNKTF